MTSRPDNGIIHLRSPYTFANTLQRLESAITTKGIAIFARIDHSGEAAKVGLTMPPTGLLIFGSPKSGTPLMIASPALALDLPLKALVSQDTEGAVWLPTTARNISNKDTTFPKPWSKTSPVSARSAKRSFDLNSTEAGQYKIHSDSGGLYRHIGHLRPLLRRR
jgi:uncharacterized protein (DUF302 family)